MKPGRHVTLPLLICFLFESGVVHYFPMTPEERKQKYPDAPRVFDVDVYDRDGNYLGRFVRMQLPSIKSARNMLADALPKKKKQDHARLN